MKAVAQSGNKGAHLQPSTMGLPKQLMPVGSKQVLELPFK
jgi:dTDP-glucose pyrophosphorylase